MPYRSAIDQEICTQTAYKIRTLNTVELTIIDQTRGHGPDILQEPTI